jgi:2-polyprenyl-6-methoxyphenol hydroxylase-like FAD-dependent oxidoreductase
MKHSGGQVKAARALVLGDGISGLTCARLLGARGWRVECVAGRGTPGPVVLLTREIAELMLELWQADHSLFAGAHLLQGRSVHWEDALAPSYSLAPALVIPVKVLQTRFARRAAAGGLPLVAPEQVDPAAYDWIVQAGGRDVAAEPSIAFGHRQGIAASIKLAPRARIDHAVMESIPGGWLFLIPQGPGRGTLQGVFADPIFDPARQLATALGLSRVMARLVDDVVDEPARFSAAPRLAPTPCAPRSILVGDAAMTLDPLSGNGIGSGLRGAILAAAVLDAASAPEPDVVNHYAWRLREAMRSHVRSCIDLYRRAAHANCWSAEIAAMIEMLGRLPAEQEVPQFVLNHGRLERRGAAVAAAATHAV